MRILKKRALISSTIMIFFVINLFWLFHYDKRKVKFTSIIELTSNKHSDKAGDNDNVLELRNMIKYMFRVGAFLVDVNYLNRIVNEIHLNASNEKLSRDCMTFGLIADNFSIFNDKDLKKSFNMTCKITKTKGHLINQTVDTNIYFTCPNVKVQVSLFHERSEYLWIGQDEESEEKTPLWFGDTPRAVQYIEKQIVAGFNNDDLLYIPLNLKKFLFDYKHSKFYECNHEVAHGMKIELKENHTKSSEELLKFKFGLRSLSELLEGLYKPYIINSGTLLGWYRHCGIIPHTTDVDFSMRLDDYDVNLKKALLGNKNVHLVRIFGTRKYGLEYRTLSKGIQFDLFFLSNFNSTHWWTGYHFTTVYLKQYHRRFNEFCSCELLGIKLLIPCEPEKTLVHNYGPNWRKPNFGGGWSSVGKDKFKFQNEDWKDRVRIYNEHGQLNEKESIDYMNRNNEGIRPEITKIFDDAN